MHQLRIPIVLQRTNPVQAVYAIAASLGWTYESQNGHRRERYYLPETQYYLRANPHRTTLYQMIDGAEYMVQKSFDTRQLHQIAGFLQSFTPVYQQRNTHALH